MSFAPNAVIRASMRIGSAVWARFCSSKKESSERGLRIEFIPNPKERVPNAVAKMVRRVDWESFLEAILSVRVYSVSGWFGFALL